MYTYCVCWDDGVKRLVAADGNTGFVRPRSGDVAWGVASAADEEEVNVERFAEVDTGAVALDLDVKSAETISSEGLAAAAGVNSAKLRKDLSHLGSYGTRGVGYDVALLTAQIEYILGLDQRRAVCLVGVGNLGHALAGYDGFASRGFRIVALFDADPSRVGEEISGLTVRHIDELPQVAAVESIAIGVIATPASAAQAVADDLVAAP